MRYGLEMLYILVSAGYYRNTIYFGVAGNGIIKNEGG
jgi:hypothetical protein